jgi:hypothetical protein
MLGRSPDVRAAMALEDAGELQHAARVFEVAGEHAQAAALRLEHANTLRDQGARLRVLREAAARIPAGAPETRPLFRALGDALSLEADRATDEAARRGLWIDAAAAYDDADEGALAGELFERVGLWARAARSYERAGAVDRLEYVLEWIERGEQHGRSRRDFELAVEAAWTEGRRREAIALVEREHARGDARVGPLVTERERLIRERRLFAAHDGGARLLLAWAHGRASGRTWIKLGDTLRLGRAPDADVIVHSPAVSREHAELRLIGDAVHVIDLGTRSGTFVAGDALAPGEPLAVRGRVELALGWAPPLQVIAAGGEALVVRGSEHAGPAALGVWLSQLGGAITLAPERRIPARLWSAGGWLHLTSDDTTPLWLNDTPLGPGATVDLLEGDVLRLVPPRGDACALAVERWAAGPAGLTVASGAAPP